MPGSPPSTPIARPIAGCRARGRTATWSVVKVGLAPGDPARTAETRADEKPATGDDPRSSAMRNLGPNIGPGI